MGPIGSKICHEDVSRDDPKQTIDSRPFGIDSQPMMKRRKRKLIACNREAPPPTSPVTYAYL